MEKYRQNIFGIGEIYELQREGQWVEKNRESYREYGYFGGGRSRTSLQSFSTIDRIDYSNDTITFRDRTYFNTVRLSFGSSSNSNFGYFGGGNPGPRSSVERLNYSNETITISSNLSLSRTALAASGNNNFGYFCGGFSPATSTVSTIDRLNYSNDSQTAVVRGPLSSARAYLAATGNSNFGYFGGGGNLSSPSLRYSSLDRVNYSNDTNTALARSPFEFIVYNTSAATGNSNYGYFAGGSLPTIHSRILRIDYSNDTTLNTVRSNLSLSRFSTSATGNSNFGYFAGGHLSSPSDLAASIIDRLDYANDTQTASVRGPLSSAKGYHAATSSASFGGSPVSYLGAPWVATAPFGYFGGGGSPGSVQYSTVERINYSNDTDTASIRGPLTISRGGSAAIGNQSFGYFAGGADVAPNPDLFYSNIDRIDYSNDTNTTVNTASLTGGSRRQLAATGNSNFGYFGGGINQAVPATYSTIDRINYSNNTLNTSVRGVLTATRYAPGASGNNNFGYWAGSRTPDTSTIDRLDYSNDTATTISRGNLVFGRGFLSGVTANSGYAYYGGGFTPGGAASYVERQDFSNDTLVNSRRGDLSFSRSRVSSTGNSNFGYWGGTNTVLSRVDFSNDTDISSSRGSLLGGRTFDVAASSSQAFGGAPNTTTDPIPTYIRANTVWNDSNTLDVPYKRVLGSYGYFGGGAPFPISTVDRIDYSNDLTTASVRGSLSLNRYQFSATGNSNFGYYIAGNIASPSVVVASIDRIDYSNDVATALLRGNTTSGSAGRSFGATGNSNFGYIGNWTYVTTTNRIDYSNDNLTASVRGPLSSAKGYAVATGNQNFGYFGAGAFFPGAVMFSTVDRIDYSNDLSRSSVRGPLSFGRRLLAATGNSNFGYYSGGFVDSVPATYSTVERINYSNDIVTVSIRGPLNSERRELSATGNSNFGYFSGGTIIGISSTVDRINYSNDTATASVRGPLSLVRSNLAASTNARNS